MDTNRISSRVVGLMTNNSLNLVKLSSSVGNLTFVCLDILLSLDEVVTIGFKSSVVAICKGHFDGALSHSNQIKVKICDIQKGEILTKIIGDNSGVFISSLITTDSANKLNLSIGESVLFLIKSTDMFLVENGAKI